MNTVQICNFKGRRPRRNLPVGASRKRGESNFVAAFSKAYVATVAPQGIGGCEFAVSNFGIADFVWLHWQRDDQDGAALSIEKIKLELARRKLTAFEMKLTDWRKGLAQAYRYGYFSDLAIVVLPPESATLARGELTLFRKLNVGLWSFHRATGRIRRHFTPRASKPRNAKAREKALALLGAALKLGKFAK